MNALTISSAVTSSSRHRSSAQATKVTGTRKLPSRIRVGRRLVFAVSSVTTRHAIHSARPARKTRSQVRRGVVPVRAALRVTLYLPRTEMAVGSGLFGQVVDDNGQADGQQPDVLRDRNALLG